MRGFAMEPIPVALPGSSAIPCNGVPASGGQRLTPWRRLASAEPAAQAPTVRIVRKGIGIEVRVEHVEPGGEPRLVALVPARQGGRTAVQALKPARDEPRTWFARFEQDDGDFVVVLEPIATDQEPAAE